MAEEVQHWRVTYNDIHNLIRKATPSIGAEFNPDLLVAIGMLFDYPFARCDTDILLLRNNRRGVSSFFFLIPSFCTQNNRLFRGFFPARVMVMILSSRSRSHELIARGLLAYVLAGANGQEGLANTSHRSLAL